MLSAIARLTPSIDEREISRGDPAERSEDVAELAEMMVCAGEPEESSAAVEVLVRRVAAVVVIDFIVVKVGEEVSSSVAREELGSLSIELLFESSCSSSFSSSFWLLMMLLLMMLLEERAGFKLADLTIEGETVERAFESEAEDVVEVEPVCIRRVSNSVCKVAFLSLSSEISSLALESANCNS